MLDICFGSQILVITGEFELWNQVAYEFVIQNKSWARHSLSSKLGLRVKVSQQKVRNGFADFYWIIEALLQLSKPKIPEQIVKTFNECIFLSICDVFSVNTENYAIWFGRKFL